MKIKSVLPQVNEVEILKDTILERNRLAAINCDCYHDGRQVLIDRYDEVIKDLKSKLSK